jgi:hypothetical protein
MLARTTGLSPLYLSWHRYRPATFPTYLLSAHSAKVLRFGRHSDRHLGSNVGRIIGTMEDICADNAKIRRIEIMAYRPWQ